MDKTNATYGTTDAITKNLKKERRETKIDKNNRHIWLKWRHYKEPNEGEIRNKHWKTIDRYETTDTIKKNLKTERRGAKKTWQHKCRIWNHGRNYKKPQKGETKNKNDNTRQIWNHCRHYKEPNEGEMRTKFTTQTLNMKPLMPLQRT